MRPRVRKVSDLDVWGTLSERFWCLEGLRGGPRTSFGGAWRACAGRNVIDLTFAWECLRGVPGSLLEGLRGVLEADGGGLGRPSGAPW